GRDVLHRNRRRHFRPVNRLPAGTARTRARRTDEPDTNPPAGTGSLAGVNESGRITEARIVALMADGRDRHEDEEGSKETKPRHRGHLPGLNVSPEANPPVR